MWEFIFILLSLAFVIVIIQLKSLGRDLRQHKSQFESLRQRVQALENTGGSTQSSKEVAEPHPLLRPDEDVLHGARVIPDEPISEPVTFPSTLSQTPTTTEEAVTVSSPPQTSAVPYQPSPPPLPSVKGDGWGQWEKALGLRWTTWVGGLILFLGAGLFVKYAFEQSWLGPWARVGFSAAAGLALLFTGERLLRRDMLWLGQGLIGVGLAILYAASYGAYGRYHLLPQPATFFVMIIITTVGMGLAVWREALSIAFLAVLGGFITPLLLRTGEDARDVLFAYLLLLDLGVLGVAWFRRWRALDVLAFIGTAILFAQWFLTYHHTATYHVVPTVLWMMGFYLVFLVIPFVFHLRLAIPVTGERFFLAVSNAMAMFGGLYTVLHPEHKHVLGFMTLAMSVAYLGLGMLIQRRIKSDRQAVFGCAALFLALLTVSIPIHLDLFGVTIAWAVEAPLLLYLAYVYPYKPMRLGSLIPLGLAVGRLFLFHWPLHTAPFVLLFNGSFGTALFIVVAGTGHAWINQQKKLDDTDAEVGRWIGLGSALLGLFILHNELWLWLELTGHPSLQRWVTSMVWTLGSLGFLWTSVRRQTAYLYITGLGVLVLGGILCLWDYILGTFGAGVMVINGRCLASLFNLTGLLVFGKWSAHVKQSKTGHPQLLKETLYSLGVFLIVLLFHVETWLWLSVRDLDYMARCMLPMIWVAGAVALGMMGIRVRSYALRMGSIVLTAIALALALLGYGYRMESRLTMCLNGRFLSSWMPILMALLQASILYPPKPWRHPKESKLSDVLFGGAILAASVVTSLEVWYELKSPHPYGLSCVLPWIWTAGGVTILILGERLKLRQLRTMALAFAGMALFWVAWAYEGYHTHLGRLYVNVRFFTACAPIALLFVQGLILRRDKHTQTTQERSLTYGLFVSAMLLLFVLLNVETALHTLKGISDPDQARWITQMALSLIWGLYATGLLVLGFARRIRAARLCALGLFGLTALKLVFIDLAQAEEVYRIISFVVLGLLIIAASYLYHRMEKRLAMNGTE